jgi:hypothetical protein
VPRPTTDTMARNAWEQLVSSGAATAYVTAVLSVGLEDYVARFSHRYLGSQGANSFKLVLGLNGEGKTHFLHNIETAALDQGHLVAFVEARSAGAADSSFEFAREVMANLRIQSSAQSDEQPLLLLLRQAVEQRRTLLEQDGLDAGALLPVWAEEMRSKAFQPLEFAQALSDGLIGVITDDLDRTLSAIRRLTFEGTRFTNAEKAVQGPKLLRSIRHLPKVLGFNRLVLLLDEAEVAFEGLAQKRRQTLLAFLRFLNDHLAHGEDADGAVIFVACTDDFWPGKFNEYAALKGRLSDPGYDQIDQRLGLSGAALVNKNKIWVRETFRGTEADYLQLADALVVVAARVWPGLDTATQTRNGQLLAEVASSDSVNRVIKRPFVKAFAQLIDSQLLEEQQREIDSEQAHGLFDVAKRAIVWADQKTE